MDIDLDFLRDLLLEAGQMALGGRGQMTAAVKADHTPVTEVDRQVEDYLIARIGARYPDHQVLSEESGLHPGASTTTWVIDPIDGTRSFAAGLPIWGVSIGILEGGAPAAGGLYLPVTGEMYWGTSAGAYYNARPLAPIRPPDFDNPLVFLAVPSSFYLYYEVTFPRARSMGSTAAHLAYATTGAAAGVLLHAVSLWDIAGMLPVMSAVGVQVAPLSGGVFDPASLLGGQKIREPLLAAHPAVMDALRESIRKK